MPFERPTPLPVRHLLAPPRSHWRHTTRTVLASGTPSTGPLPTPAGGDLRTRNTRPARRTPGRPGRCRIRAGVRTGTPDRKSTRLNSSHRCISYAVFCLKKKTSPEPQHHKSRPLRELACDHVHEILHYETH